MRSFLLKKPNYVLFEKYILNQFSFSNNYIANFDFSKTISNNFEETIQLQADFKFLLSKLTKENKKKFIVKGTSTSYYYFIKKNNKFSREEGDYLNKLTKNYQNIDKSIFFDQSECSKYEKNFFNNTLFNDVDFVSNLDGSSKIINSKNKKIIMDYEGKIINENGIYFSLVSLYEIYKPVFMNIKKLLIDFIYSYNEEVNTINKNILATNNKIVKCSTFSIFNGDLEISDSNYESLRLNEITIFNRISDPLNFTTPSKTSRINIPGAHAQYRMRVQNMVKSSNTYSYGLKPADITKSKQIQFENKYFDILNHFKQIQFMLSSYLENSLAFMNCSHSKLSQKIYNPLIGEEETVYQINGDVIVGDIACSLEEMTLIYTEHSLLFFELSKKHDKKLNEIFEVGFSQYYATYEIKDKVKNF